MSQPDNWVSDAIRSMVGSLNKTHPRTFRNGGRVVPIPDRTPKKLKAKRRAKR